MLHFSNTDTQKAAAITGVNRYLFGSSYHSHATPLQQVTENNNQGWYRNPENISMSYDIKDLHQTSQPLQIPRVQTEYNMDENRDITHSSYNDYDTNTNSIKQCIGLAEEQTPGPIATLSQQPITAPSRKSRRKKNRAPLCYKPTAQIRLRSNVYVSDEMKEHIADRIQGHYKEMTLMKKLFCFMDGHVTMQFDRYQNTLNENTKIFNFGFIDKDSNEELFCIVDRQRMSNNKTSNVTIQNRCQWRMRDKLYTKETLVSCKIINTMTSPPKSLKLGLDHSPTPDLKQILYQDNWHKLKIISSKVQAKERVKSSILLSEMVEKVKDESVNDLNAMELIPILMFDNICPKVHAIVKLQIGKDLNIGISMIYDEHIKTWRKTGIHINKNTLLMQHRWISLDHINCNCFEHFQENKINFLKIVDDSK